MNKLTFYYVLLLVIHTLHLVEEIFGRAYFIDSFYNGIMNFLIINIVLLIIPATLLYFVSKKNKLALYLAFIYPIIMIMDGVDHVVEFFVRDAYFDGVVGLVTGVVFLPISVLLILKLKQALSKSR